MHIHVEVSAGYRFSSAYSKNNPKDVLLPCEDTQMYGNHEVMKQLTSQRLQARYQDAALHRLIKQQHQAKTRQHYRRFNLNHLFHFLLKLLPQDTKETRPAIQKG